MSDSPPPDVAPGAAGAGVSALTPEAVAAVLDDFRAWLTAAAAAPAEPAPAARVDLATLVGQFTALRHEVNLQTRAVRAQQEQNAETLRRLTEALDALSRTPAASAGDDGLRPLLKTLVDLYDAAALAGRELQRVQETVTAALRPLDETAAEEDQNKGEPRPSWWARWFGRPSDAVRRRREREARRGRVGKAREAAARASQTLAATAAGFAMTLKRVERAMAQHGLESIPAAGRPFDPERMEAVEVVPGSGRPAGEVVDEVRRGYLWQGRVFRYAQVRVAKDGG